MLLCEICEFLRRGGCIKSRKALPEAYLPGSYIKTGAHVWHFCGYRVRGFRFAWAWLRRLQRVQEVRGLVIVLGDLKRYIAGKKEGDKKERKN